MRSVLPLAFFFYICFPAISQTTTPDFDSTFAIELQQALVQYGQSSGIKGLSAAAIVPGQGIWTGTYGNATPGAPVTPDMRFGIASNTKAITAALLLKLQEEGLLDLDDTVGEYLPPHPHINSNITLRQLLTHTSGLFDFINDWTNATSSTYYSNPNKTWTPDDLLATVGPPAMLPGTAYDYSNTNYLLAGMVAAAAADTTIEHLLHSRIFSPLQLDMAYPPYDNVFAGPYANLWSGNSTTLDPGNDNGFLSFPATAGSVWSTAYDMVRWYDALFGSDWLSPQSQAELRSNDGYNPYGLGIRLRNEFGVSFYYHAGVWGFRSYNIHVPDHGISVCVLANDYNASVGTFTKNMLKQILETKPKKERDAVIQKILHPRGTHCAGNADPVKVQIRNRGLSPLASVWVKYGVDGVWQDSFQHDLTSPVPSNFTAFIELDLPLSATDEDVHRFQLQLEPLSGDDYPADNIAFSDYRILSGEGQHLPYHEDFEMEEYLPQEWISYNPRDILDWRRTDFAAASAESSLVRNNYSDANVGAIYSVELPPLFIATESAELSFSFAHAASPGYDDDKLRIAISDDCGETFQTVMTIAGGEFETAPPTSNLFLAFAWFHWESRNIPLGDYAGKTVIIRFDSVNGFSNHLYLDDVKVENLVPAIELLAEDDIKITPNPAGDFFEVELPRNNSGRGKVEIVLVNASGMVVRRSDFSFAEKIKVERAELPAGVYFLQMVKEGEISNGVQLVFD